MMQTDLFSETCGLLHPTLGTPCRAPSGHQGTHTTMNGTSAVSWTPTGLAAEPLRAAARTHDPESSRHAASYDFGVKGGYRGLAQDILDCADDTWMTARALVECIFGPGPYTYDEAVAINKVQTVALQLWRRGELERCEDCDAFLTYRQHQSA